LNPVVDIDYFVYTTLNLAIELIGQKQKEEKHEEIYTECMLILLIKFPCRIFRFESPWWLFTRLAPNDRYRGRTAPLTSKRCILYIYSTNIGTEYFMVYTLRFFLFKMQFVS